MSISVTTKTAIKLFVLCAMLMGLPLLGVVLAGKPVDSFLEFPPRTRYVSHEPFSWTVFLGLALLVSAVVAPFAAHRPDRVMIRPERRFERARRLLPWWGWVGVGVIVVSWIVAWGRFSWVAWFQAHTFAPLWLGYILTVNGLLFGRTGKSPLTHRTAAYLSLFPISAGFWWFFEYLNRFVQNWYYLGEPLDPWSYFWYATLPFSTVLPAVLATRAWLRSVFQFDERFRSFMPVQVSRPRPLAVCVLVIAGIGLSCLGVRPNLLFPLLWISPLLIIVSVKTLLGEPHVFSPASKGDWGGIVTAALAALICGFFWEMWNFWSHARWVYSIPYVHRFPLFEMPLLGYAGYLPFGLECVAAAELFLGRKTVEIF